MNNISDRALEEINSHAIKSENDFFFGGYHYHIHSTEGVAVRCRKRSEHETIPDWETVAIRDKVLNVYLPFLSETSNMYRYIAVEENANNSDVEMDVFCDPEEANTQAKLIWNGLTPEEKENNHVYTIYVTSEDLSPDAWKEDGRIDWTRWENYRDFEGSFDSARELE